MSQRIDLTDPAFEPTDEQLVMLSKSAFAGVREVNLAALESLRAEIKHERARVLAHVRGRAEPR